MVPEEKHPSTAEVLNKWEQSRHTEDTQLVQPLCLVSNLQKMGRQYSQSHRGREKKNQQYIFLKKVYIF